VKKEIKTILTKNDKELKDLNDEVRRLRKQKQLLGQRDHRASMVKINETPINDIGYYPVPSIVSSPEGVIRHREHDVYRQKYDTNTYMTKTDAGIGPNEPETSGFILLSSVRGSSSSNILQIPEKGSVFIKVIEDAARTFIDIFCKLGPRVLRSLWERYAIPLDREKVGILRKTNIAVFLDNLILYAFRQENPHHPLPSKWKTESLVSFIEFKLDPYIGKKKYLTFEHFMKFPQWLRGIKLKSEVSVKPLKKAIEYLSSKEEAMRRRLKVGSSCTIWSKGEKMWCKGDVIDTKYDGFGEWLVVRYVANNFIIEKEVQRFSTLLRISQQVLRGTNPELKDYQG